MPRTPRSISPTGSVRAAVHLVMANAITKVSAHESFTAALLAAGELEDGAVRHLDGAWCAVRLNAGTAERYNRRADRAARRPGYADV